MNLASKLLSLVLMMLFSISSANADVIAATLSCKKNQISWKAEYKVDKGHKTVLGMRFFNFNNGRPDGRYIKVQSKSKATFFKNGTVKYLKYGLYNDMSQFNRFEFYEMMGRLDKNGQPYARCAIVGTKILSRSTYSHLPPKTSTPLQFSKKTVPLDITRHDDTAFKAKTWQSEWTNPNGSKSSTNLVLSNIPEPDGRVGNYDWSNGRFLGSYSNNGSRFEGNWVQDKSGQRCNDSVNGSFYHGKVWFQMSGSNTFNGKWGYCSDTPQLDWQGWR